ncbi:MAG: hypothetical protein M1836_004491 [Candelina mexicana]|nr:MAG: hypothetical protein M1836_004491 [Candelina mexicana]
MILKLDNNADDIMRLIAETIRQIASPRKPWNERIVLGCWAGKFLPLCHQYLPNFPITHIGFSIAYARQFLDIPNISFNMLQRILMGPLGRKFLRDARTAHRPMYAWTVNEVEMMRWCIEKEIDGAITDDPKTFLEVCRDWEVGRRGTGIKVRQWLLVYWVNFIVVFFSFMFMWRYGFRIRKGWSKRSVQLAQ